MVIKALKDSTIYIMASASKIQTQIVTTVVYTLGQ